MEIKSLLCIGGPIDGEIKAIHKGQRELFVATVPPMRMPTRAHGGGYEMPDASELSFTEHRYSLLRLESDLEFLYYEPDGPSASFRKLLSCYAPRLAKLAQDEQRRHV